MNADCTILIPTHNRHRYLERCVRWFLELGFPIAIADSSDTAWDSAMRGSAAISYIHLPGGFEIYPKKLQAALATVSTPLVAPCADDDFITKEGLSQSIDFLRANADYSAALGYAYSYQVFGSRTVLWPMVYDHHDVPGEAWLDRVEQAKSSVYYGVNRTRVLSAATDFLSRQDFSEIANSCPAFFDLAYTAHAAKSGKFKRCPVPFSLREYAPVVSTAGGRFLTITSRNVPDFYRNLYAFIADDNHDEIVRRRLLKLFSNDYAGQLSVDLVLENSRKRYVRHLPAKLVGEIEFLYRLYAAARMYSLPKYRSFLKIFRDPEYQRFKSFVGSQGEA